MQRWRRVSALLLALSLATSLSGCKVTTSSSRFWRAWTACGFELKVYETQKSPKEKKADWTELKNDTARAVEVVGEFWKRHWEECHLSGWGPFPDRYVAPMVFQSDGFYTRADAPICGTTKLEPLNASYCLKGNYVAWDEDLMKFGTQLGDAWVYVVVAHEWGHAVQRQLPGRFVSDRLELQADCLAGAALYGADLETDFIWQDNDVDEAAVSLIRAADKTAWAKQPQGQPAAHGNSLERIYAFQDGRAGGVAACITMP